MTQNRNTTGPASKHLTNDAIDHFRDSILSGDNSSEIDSIMNRIIADDARAYIQQAREGEVTLPSFNIYDTAGELVADVQLKKHNDETSYRRALEEASVAIHFFSGKYILFLYETTHDSYGALAIGHKENITGVFLDKDGEKAKSIQQDLKDSIDLKTVGVLRSMINIPGNSRYLANCMQTLESRGHIIRVHKDSVAKLDKSFFL